MDMNTCDQCGRGNASIQYTEVAEGQISKLHLCHSCAESHGLLGEQDEGASGVDALISRISQSNSPAASESPLPSDICGSCELSWAEFEVRGVLGCEECYKTFAARLAPMMHDRHQAEPRADTRRRKASDPTALLPELRALLEQSIRDEDYEKAALLRDRIQRAEAQQGTTPADESSEPGE